MEVLQQVREFSDVPVIMLTARGDDMDKILGLDYGADDYVTKPFNPLEVKGRIKAIIRRTSRARKAEEVKENIIEVGDLRMDLDNRRVTLSDKFWPRMQERSTAVRCFCRWCGGRIILETSEQSMYISGACAKRLSTMLPNLNMSRQNGESDTISAATKGKKR